MSIAIQGRVEGKVQGVGFRYFTLEQARAIGLTGYVKNLSDGSVAFLIQGDQGSIDDMLEKLRVGPMMARVKEVLHEVVDGDAELQDFEIR